MKAFIVIAFALCYFLQDGVEGGTQLNWRYGLKMCFKGHGFVNKGKKDLRELQYAMEYYKFSFAHFVKYNSAELDDILEVIGWKIDALTADQRKNLTKVLGRRSNRRLKALQKVIDDVKKQFKSAADGDEALYRKLWKCVESTQLFNPANLKSYLALPANSASCAETVIGKKKAKELDLAKYRFHIDMLFMSEIFGSNTLGRALQRLNIYKAQGYLQLILRPLEKKSLFTPEEKHLGNYYLPGKFSFVSGAFRRFSDRVKKVSTTVNNKGKKRNRGKPDAAKAKQLIGCILSNGKQQG